MASPHPTTAPATGVLPESAAGTGTPLLEARSLVKEYGSLRAVDGLTLAVKGGEIYCLLGPNGAGKSTTINCFLGFASPTSGQVLIKGMEVGRHPVETKRSLAYIPEQVNLYRGLTGVENLEYLASLAGRPRSRSELANLLVEAGLQAEAVNRRVGTYSKGMRQKVAVALAMAKEAEVLLLDEPTSGLDPRAANEFGELLGRLRSRGVAILMATHDLFRARETGDRVGIMNQGRLVRELATGDIGHADLERIYLEHMHD
jgi:ABC-2 type transport system ATP-binding protein